MSISHHGIIIKEALAGEVGTGGAPMGVVGLVGTAPNFLASAKPTGKPALITSDRGAASFGPELPGYTIPSALKSVLRYGSARIVVIDVFEPERHSESVANEAITLDDRGEAALANVGIISAELAYNGNALVEGTDYRLDRAWGIISRIKTGALPPKASLTATYEYGDPSKVTNAEIVGAIDDAGLRTGIEALVDADSLFGFAPRRLIAPGYCTAQSVQQALIAVADKLGAIAYLDVPVGASVQQVLEGRGENGAINLGASSQRAVWCYPHVKVPDPRTEEHVLQPASQHVCGLAVYVEAAKGYHHSPSNHELLGVVDIETPVQWSIDDPNCEANLLNDAGITTIIRPYGAGYTLWGNRSAAWPTERHPVSFVVIRVVADRVRAMVLQLLRPYIDRPLNAATLNSAKANVQAALDVEVQRGALTGASFTWSPEDNPHSELALGNAVFELSFMGPPPWNKAEVNLVIDTKWLKETQGAV